MKRLWDLLTILALLSIAVGRALGAEAADLRLSIGYEPSLPVADRASLDLPMDDERYLPVTFEGPEDRAVRLQVDVPTDWSRQIEVYREERTAQRRQLVPLSAEPVWLKSAEPAPAQEKASPPGVPGDPHVLWLHVSSQGKPAGQHRIPLRVCVGNAEAPLTLELRVWPVSLATADRPFHVRGYWMFSSLTGGYEVNEESIRRLDAFLQVYAEMGGNVLDWCVNWPEVFPRIPIAGTGQELDAGEKATPASLDLDQLPGLDFSYFDPWFEAAWRHGVTRFETYLPNTASDAGNGLWMPRWARGG